MTAYDKLMGSAWRDNVLHTALLELTYRCNLDCFFCYNDLALRGKSMKLEDYRTLLDDLAEMQVMVLSLSGGEPLAHPDFFEIGRAARDRGFVVRIKSNGHALRGELARRLKEEVDPFVIEVSLHGANAETHDRQTRVPGSFDRLLENLQGLREIGLRFKINSTLTRWNENEQRQMYAIADSFGVALQIDPIVTPRDDGNVEPLDVTATPDGIREFARVRVERSGPVRAKDLTRPTDDAELPDDDSEKLCGAGSMTIAVDPFGNVYPCVAWRTPVGNLHESSIRAIWDTSFGLRKVREGTVSAKKMLDAEGEPGRYMSFCPGLAVTRTGRPDEIPADQRKGGEALMDAFEDALETDKDRSSR